MDDTFTNPIITVSSLREFQKGHFWYLATPYSATEWSMMCSRATQAGKVAGQLMSQGLFIFSPIWHCHEIARIHDLPTDHKYWWEYNYGFIAGSCGIIVVKMTGWQESKGVKAEIELAKDIGRRVFYYDPMTETFSE